LEEMGLLDEIKKLHDEGYGTPAIVQIVSQHYPEKVEKVGGISHMSVDRALKLIDRMAIQEQIKQGINPVDEFNREFREKMDKNTEELESIKKKAGKILEEAMESDSIADKTKALKEVRDTLTQMAKNYVALQQFYQMKVNNLQKEAYEQQEHVKRLLVIAVAKLEEVVCPICKEKAINEFVKVIETEGE